ncbi:hypothetical protein HHI36_013712 [Cryptolaemus montrouzieri]|uniref:ABC transporter domain-containing protein n=1 Tax=Cryptolaemus montrouzieri TaxID=559131 RepID=A0ABD2NIP5_9CUCU
MSYPRNRIRDYGLEESDQFQNSSGEYEYKISDQCLKDWRSTFGGEVDCALRKNVEEQVTFSWCDINVFTKTRSSSLVLPFSKKESTQKHILKNVSGIAYPSELLVIMGSSGAGKTTLMNCMTFRNLKNLSISGTVCINNTAVTQTQLAAHSAYVQQDDLFVKFLTVKEHLTFQSELRMDSNLTRAEKMQRVEEVMLELSLKKCEFCIIGQPGVVKGISGGERKRLALASEMLTNPSILFCDEPTTGLDSFMALNVVQILRDIARTGRTVITTLHLPSSELFCLFDKVCLMAEGRTAFLGTVDQANSFFTKLGLGCPKNYNPANHYIQLLSIRSGREVECKQAVNTICDAFDSSSLGFKIRKTKDKIAESIEGNKDSWSSKQRNLSPYRASWFTQFRALFWRSWMSLIQNPDMTIRRILVLVLECLLMLLIYYGQILNQAGIKNIDGVFFYLLMNSTSNIFIVIETFCSELPLFLKEHKDGMYRTDVYYLAKIICSMPMSIICSFLTTTLLYFLVGMNGEIDRYLTAVIISILSGQVALGLGYVISALSPDVYVATPLVSIFTTPLFLFGGIFLSFSSIPPYFRWIAALSWIKDGYQAYMINQWDDISHIKCEYNSSAVSACIKNGIEVLDSVAVTVDDFWPAIESMLVLFVFYRLVGFFILLLVAYFKE